jgi:hypothetical protein
MPIDDKPYVGDVGTTIEADSEVDLTGNIVLQMEIIKPDKTLVNWSSTIKSGDVNIAQYITQSGDFDQAGMYKGNLFASWASGYQFHGKTFCFEVFNLGE